MDKEFANIIVDVTADALNKSFIYKVPSHLLGKVKRGDKVLIPFGNGKRERVKEGFVLELLTLDELKNKKFYKTDKYFKNTDAIINLKEISDIDKNSIAALDILLKIAIYMYKEYAVPIASCINAVLPVKRLVKKNKRQVDVVENYEVKDRFKQEKDSIVLNVEQKTIIEDIINEHKKNVFNEHLIYGITGSGKTEVYISVIEEVLKEGKEVIVLIPEIALTHQTVIRLKNKFENEIAIIHSKMSKGEKYIQYQKCIDGNAHILVGPRSAIFAPFENLGLIVIDEVHDLSYKSEVSPRYDTLDIARFRCNEQSATLLALSATPKVSYFHEAKNSDRIKLHILDKRASGDLPIVTVVDMKKEKRISNSSLLSQELISAVRERLTKKEQVMIFMNKRGYDRVFTCKSCGETYTCPHCDVALVAHSDGKMKCHYCGYEVDEPIVCPHCKSSEIEKYGLGTEKLEEICMDLFEGARILRLDRDTTKNKGSLDKIIETFRDGKADILIGTEMIVKGHDFPLVTLVAILRGDLTLHLNDYKAAENTFSLITQCVGRSGRKLKGESIIEAYDVDSFVIDCAAKQDYISFFNKEIEIRKKLNYPPFKKILTLTLMSNMKNVLEDIANNLKIIIEKKNKVNAIVLGPTSMNPERINDIYYKRIIIKCNTKIEAKQFRTLSYSYVDYIDRSKIVKIISDIE